MDQYIFYIIITINLFASVTSNNKKNNVGYNIPDPDCTGVFNLCTDVDKERLGRQAIKAIHEQMDDDKDGLIEASESRDFIQEELESKSDSVRHRRFQNADLQITFDDLWTQWKNNPVYNWSNDEVIHWLVNHVHLSAYVEYFRRNQIDGRMIPRLAANEKQYISTIMQIRDPRHKRRLIIKATDIVLFGPPQRTHSLIKDIILISALLISIGACLYAFVRHRKTQESMKMMLRELESLQKAEGDLFVVTGKIKTMENEFQDKSKVDRGLLNSWFLEVQRTKEEAEKFRKRRDTTVDNDKQLRLAVQEIEQLRIALRKAEEHARHQSYDAPAELIDLLKRTYHIEDTTFDQKRKSAEVAMLTAKDQMTKISKMQKGFFGAVRIAHTGCMDNISELINTAKERLAQVHDEHEEREQRWNRIASLLDRNDLMGSSTITNDSTNRNKQTSIESASIINSNTDSSSIGKQNSNFNNRGFPINSLHSTQISQQDTINQSDAGFEQSNSSTVTRNRLTTNSRGPSIDHIINNSSMLHSYSTNGINDLHRTIAVLNRPHTYDSVDGSSSKPAKSSFEGVSDRQIVTNDSMYDDQLQQLDGNSQLISSSNDDRQSVHSVGKSRKTIISTKLFKPFQNIRFRKKMTLRLSRRIISQLFIRRFVSNDSSLTTTDSDKELTTKKPSEVTTTKRAFTLINPKTINQIKRIDDAPIDNEIDFIRQRLTEKRVKNIPIETDVLIIGGAITGSAIAFFLKQRAPDLKVTVIERDWNYTTSSTTLSAGGLRQQFAIEENIQMSMYGAEFLKHIRDHLSILDNDPVPVSFHHNGYLLCGSEKSVKLFEENHQTQTLLGGKSKLLTPTMLKKQFPWLNTDGIAIGSLGVQNEGWFDPWALLTAFRQKALSLGVLYLNAELVGFDKAKRIWADGTIENQLDKALILSAEDNRIYPMDTTFVINAAGPWAGQISKMAGIGTTDDYPVALPVEPRKRYIFVFESLNGPGPLAPLFVDITGVYFRPEGLGNTYICGCSPSEDNDKSEDNLEVDYSIFEEQIWPVLAKRIPSFESLKLKNAWCGFYDYNYFDQNLIIGPHPQQKNFFFANGSSGHGLQHGPAIGRAISEYITDLKYESINLSRFGFQRVVNNTPIFEPMIV